MKQWKDFQITFVDANNYKHTVFATGTDKAETYLDWSRKAQKNGWTLLSFLEVNNSGLLH